MAERGTYRPTRGNSLLNVPQVQASDAPAQLLGAVGNVAGNLNEQFQRQQYTHQETLKAKVLTDSVRKARMTFDALAKEHPADPDSYNKKASNYTSGVVQSLRKQFPDIADDLVTRLPLMQNEVGAPVVSTYNGIAKSELRANSDIVLEDGLGRIETAGPSNADALMDVTGDYITSLRAVGPDGLPAHSPEEIANSIGKFRGAVGQSYGHAIINSETNADSLRQMAEQIRSGNFIVNAPYVQPDTGNVVVQPQNIRELLGPTGAEALANYAEARISDLNVKSEAASLDELYAANRLNDEYAAAAKAGTLSPAEFDRWREIQTTLSSSDKDLANKVSNIRSIEVGMSGRKIGYAAPVQAVVDTVRARMGNEAGNAAQEAFDQAKSDAKNDPVGYVRKMAQQTTGIIPNAENVSLAYDKMVMGLMSGDVKGASENYAIYSRGARAYLARMGYGFDTVLAASDADALASRINNTQVPEGVSPSRHKAAALRGMQAVFGRDSDKAMRDMFPTGIDRNILAASQMDYEGASTDLMNALDARPEVNKLLGEATITRINQAVQSNETVANFVASFPNNGTDVNMALAWQDNVAALAAWNARRMPESQAVQAAVDGIIGANYAMAGSLRIPKANAKGLDMAQLAKAGTPLFGQAVYAKIKDSISFPPEKAPESLLYNDPNLALEEYKKIAGFAPRMVTNSDGTGALLVDSLGAPIYANGAPVQFTLDELTSMVKPTLDAAGADELRRNTLWPGVVKTEDIVNGPPPLGQIGVDIARQREYNKNVAFPNLFKPHKRIGER